MYDKYFFSVGGFHFHFLSFIFLWAEVLNFDEASVYIRFPFKVHAFYILSNKSLPIPRSQTYLPMFLKRALSFGFYGVKYGSTNLKYGSPVYYCMLRRLLSPFNYFGFSVKMHLTIYVECNFGLSIIFHWSCLVLYHYYNVLIIILYSKS